MEDSEKKPIEEEQNRSSQCLEDSTVQLTGNGNANTMFLARIERMSGYASS